MFHKDKSYISALSTSLGTTLHGGCSSEKPCKVAGQSVSVHNDPVTCYIFYAVPFFSECALECN